MTVDSWICLEGNGYRPSHFGDGWHEGGVMYTLNGTEVHGICYTVTKDEKDNELHPQNQGGCDTYIKPDGSQGTAGKGALVQWERAGTLGVSQDQTLIVWTEEKNEEPDP